MALIKCPECGREVSSVAPNCPFCGYPINAPKGLLRVLFIDDTVSHVSSLDVHFAGHQINLRNRHYCDFELTIGKDYELQAIEHFDRCVSSPPSLITNINLKAANPEIQMNIVLNSGGFFTPNYISFSTKILYL